MAYFSIELPGGQALGRPIGVHMYYHCKHKKGGRGIAPVSSPFIPRAVLLGQCAAGLEVSAS